MLIRLVPRNLSPSLLLTRCSSSAGPTPQEAPPPPVCWRAGSSTPRLRSSPDSDRDSFAGARLLLAVDRRSRFCPSRRAPRLARATSGAVSLRSTAPPACSLRLAGRCGILSIGDRSPTSPALTRDLARLAGRARPRPSGGAITNRMRRGEPSAARRGGGLSLPRGSRRAAKRERAGSVTAAGPPLSIVGRSAARRQGRQS